MMKIIIEFGGNLDKLEMVFGNMKLKNDFHFILKMFMEFWLLNR